MGRGTPVRALDHQDRPPHWSGFALPITDLASASKISAASSSHSCKAATARVPTSQGPGSGSPLVVGYRVDGRRAEFQTGIRIAPHVAEVWSRANQRRRTMSMRSDHVIETSAGRWITMGVVALAIAACGGEPQRPASDTSLTKPGAITPGSGVAAGPNAGGLSTPVPSTPPAGATIQNGRARRQHLPWPGGRRVVLALSRRRCQGHGARATTREPQTAGLGDGFFAFIQQRVTQGMPTPTAPYSAAMPPMGGAQLTLDQVKAVAVYVYSMKRSLNAAPHENCDQWRRYRWYAHLGLATTCRGTSPSCSKERQRFGPADTASIPGPWLRHRGSGRDSCPGCTSACSYFMERLRSVDGAGCVDAELDLTEMRDGRRPFRQRVVRRPGRGHLRRMRRRGDAFGPSFTAVEGRDASGRAPDALDGRRERVQPRRRRGMGCTRKCQRWCLGPRRGSNDCWVVMSCRFASRAIRIVTSSRMSPTQCPSAGGARVAPERRDAGVAHLQGRSSGSVTGAAEGQPDDVRRHALGSARDSRCDGLTSMG